VFAVLDRGEHAWQAERQDQHADHLHHGGDAEEPVVGAVRRGEPREVGPRPADGKAREAEAERARPVVTVGERMRELRGCEPKLTTNVRSNSSSSGVAGRWVSCRSRPPMRRE
jgi:hypothetical protein